MTGRGDPGRRILDHDATIRRSLQGGGGPGESVQTGWVLIGGMTIDEHLEGIPQFKSIQHDPGIAAGGDGGEAQAEPAQARQKGRDAGEAIGRAEAIQILPIVVVFSIEQGAEMLGGDRTVAEQLFKGILAGDATEGIRQIVAEGKTLLVGEAAPGGGVQARCIGDHPVHIEQEGPDIGFRRPLSS